MYYILLSCILLLNGTIACGETDISRPAVGAIRWDAWTGGNVTRQVEQTLGPLKYHDRLPWFTEVINDATVKIDGSKPDVMDQEIKFAVAAGLYYWAFLVYPEASSMSVALQQYLHSPKRNQIHFCLILHNSLNVPTNQWPAELSRTLALLQEPGYQTDLNGRPLVYAYAGTGLRFDRFNELQAVAKKQGINPYCAYLGHNPALDFQTVSNRGFDAVSAYAKSSSAPQFTDLAKTVEQSYWQEAVQAKVPCIPLVTTGWDNRPRKEHPVSWEKEAGYYNQTVYPSRATPAEIATHLSHAVSFVKDYPRICAANTILIYAWNEYDEGGWLAPTRGLDGKPDTHRIEATHNILNPIKGMNNAKSF